MGYRNDQYYGLVNAGEKGSVVYGADVLTGALNKDFVYPDRSVRVNSVLDAGNFKAEPKLQRGYIRSIADSLGGVKLNQSKCQFQFNPRILNTSVNQNTKILDFLHQDPSQYAQPIPGNVSFSFGLFFDRSYELNKGGSETTRGYDVSSENPWEKYGPETIGVLHDISALYSVIGQGIGSQQKQYIQSVLESQIKGEINAQNTNATITTDADGNIIDDGGGVSDAASTQADYATAADDFINNLGNTGNVAFLLPLPVRVVFSALYIVEGLVQNASVKFTKFNHAMVPMQASVELVMEAKYVGFAKKNTFFTEVLAKREESELVEAQRQEQALEAIETYAGAGAQIKAATVSIIPHDDDYSKADTVEGMASERLSFRSDRKAESIKSKCEVKFKGDEGYDGLKKLFEEGIPVESRVTASATIWRFTEKFREENSDIFSKVGNGNNLSVEDKDQIIELLESYDVSDTTPISDYDGDKRPFKTVLRLKSAVVTPDDDKGTASSKEGFENQAKGVTGKEVSGVYDRAVQVDSDMAANDSQFRFLVKYEIKITLKVSGGEVTGEGHYVYIHGSTGGNFSPSHDVALTWPQASNTAQGGN